MNHVACDECGHAVKADDGPPLSEEIRQIIESQVATSVCVINHHMLMLVAEVADRIRTEIKRPQ